MAISEQPKEHYEEGGITVCTSDDKGHGCNICDSKILELVKVEMNGTFCIEPLEDALEEIRVHRECGGDDEITITNIDMTKGEYAKLPEFEGW